MRGGVVYHTNFSLSLARRRFFGTFQEELSRDGERQGLMHCFDSSGRMALGAVSYIYSGDAQPQLLIQAFHTFPETVRL